MKTPIRLSSFLFPLLTFLFFLLPSFVSAQQDVGYAILPEVKNPESLAEDVKKV
ncbi:MAG: hypothetical protein LBU27_05600 [Candidatus Peribacteria bacterium]|jgi:hypothetical protein|nr:hypothetical protein [Candidatus Peribacteria bacterium]